MAAALALAASLFAAVAGAAPGRPVAMVTPAGARVVQTSPAAQAVIGELNGSARVSVLRASLAAARTGGDLRRWALELQSIVHDRNGNYLFKLYLVLRKSDAPGARAFAELLAQEGIAIGPSSGHFERLEHMDPLAPLPPEPASARAGNTPMGQWVDAFVRADYDPSYKPSRPGSLSERLQLTYDDGSTLDIDIRLISDNYDPAPLHAVAYAYVGPGQRLFPLRLGRSTTPRLWRAKHEIALAAMYRSNQDYETLAGISVAGVMSTLPLGLVAPVQAPRSPRLGPQRARAVSAPRTTPAPASYGQRSTAAGTVPHIAKASNREMLGQAIGHVKAMPGTAAQKAEAFQKMAGQISRLSGGSWNTARTVGADGAHIFAGELGHAVVISPTGQVFLGNVTSARNFAIGSGGALQPLYNALRLVQ